MFNNKKILYIFTKVDKADKALTDKWLSFYTKDNTKAIALYERLGFERKPMPEYLIEDEGVN